MAVTDATEPATDHVVETEHRVTPLELLFDLVFVFALTQVTGLLADDPTAGGLARGVLLLGMLWWAWVAYAWLTNTIDLDADRSRLTMFAAIGAMLVASLAVPGAFGDDALLFGCAYALVRLLHLVLYARASDDAGIGLDAGEVTAAVLGLTVVAALWWAYFDVVAVVAERRMTDARGDAQVRMARDSYSFLHFPMVLGIVLMALGIKKTLAHVGDPLELVPAIGLCGGVALYLAGHIGFRWRNVHSLSRTRIVAGVLCLAVIPVATEAPALVALAGVAAICVGLIAYEVTAYREARARVRAAYA